LDVDPLQTLPQALEAQASRLAAAVMAVASLAAAFTHWFWQLESPFAQLSSQLRSV
jgi:hypothetical protein